MTLGAPLAVAAGRLSGAVAGREAGLWGQILLEMWEASRYYAGTCLCPGNEVAWEWGHGAGLGKEARVRHLAGTLVGTGWRGQLSSPFLSKAFLEGGSRQTPQAPSDSDFSEVWERSGGGVPQLPLQDA